MTMDFDRPDQLLQPHARWMYAALDLAQQAFLEGEVPVGAVIVHEERIIGAAYNQREQLKDPTAHAEILALRDAARSRGHWRLDDCTLFVTLEPCAMCAGAMINARLGRLVFGARDPKAGALVSLYRLNEDQRLNHRFPVTADCSPAASVALLQGFFRALRARGEK